TKVSKIFAPRLSEQGEISRNFFCTQLIEISPSD
ncbi:MAG: hypothetical protein ACI90V_011669, partial [Bacillariaceae sp.]